MYKAELTVALHNIQGTEFKYEISQTLIVILDFSGMINLLVGYLENMCFWFLGREENAKTLELTRQEADLAGRFQLF